MSTPYSAIINGFYKRIEEDEDFFHYLNNTEDQSMEIAHIRALGFLHEAVGELTLKYTPEIDFNDYDDETEEFSADLNNQEIFLLSSLMYERYLDRDIAKLKCLSVNYTSTDLRVFDPSNARSTFLAMYATVCHQNELLIDEYKNRDRTTGELKGVDYSSFDDN